MAEFTHASPPDGVRLSEEERASLQSMLDDEAWRERALPLPALQGYLCAIAIGPDGEPPSDWMAIALGLEADDETPVPEPLAALLERFRVETAEAVRARSLSMIGEQQRRGRVDWRTWCQGFVEGVEASATGWYEASDPEEVEELLFPILVVADALDEHERRAYKPDEWRRLLLDSEKRLDEAVMRLADYWSIVRSPPETVRRDAPKVGRNDPCPCGSGRKYKHCHGG